MPPTMIVTFGVPLAWSPASPESLLLRQAATEVARARVRTVVAIRWVDLFIVTFLFSGTVARWGRGEVGDRSEGGCLPLGRWAPGGQPDLEPGDQPLGDEREHG